MVLGGPVVRCRSFSLDEHRPVLPGLIPLPSQRSCFECVLCMVRFTTTYCHTVLYSSPSTTVETNKNITPLLPSNRTTDSLRPSRHCIMPTIPPRRHTLRRHQNKDILNMLKRSVLLHFGDIVCGGVGASLEIRFGCFHFLFFFSAPFPLALLREYG